MPVVKVLFLWEIIHSYGVEDIFKELGAIPLAVTIQFSGPYENYNPAMEKLAVWVEENGYEFTGNIRGHILAGTPEGTNLDGYLTELQVPVKKI